MLAACPFPTRQGTQVMVRHLALHLRRAGHHVELLTYPYGDADVQASESSVRSGPSLQKVLLDARLLIRAIAAAQAHHCEVVHAHGFEALALGVVVKARLKLPLVYHAHSALGLELPTYYHSRLMQVAALLAGRAFDHLLPRIADATIVFDTDQRALYRGFGVEASRLHIVPPGIDAADLGDPDPLLQARLRCQLGGGPWVLYAGNPDGYQNLELLWEAARILRKRLPQVRILVASHHPAASFASTIKQAGVGDSVHFYRYQNQQELRSLLALATIGVCPRVLPVGAPIKVLNYLAAGLPVVACRTSAQHLLTTECGRLVDANPAAFAQGIVELIEPASEEPGATRAQQCLRAFAPFHMARHVRAYENVYATVVPRPWAAGCGSRALALQPRYAAPDQYLAGSEP